MDQHTLSVLEFEKIRSIIASFCTTETGRKACSSIAPLEGAGDAQESLSETGEMFRFLDQGRKIIPGSFGDPAEDLSGARNYSRALEPDQLSGVVSLLRSAQSLKQVLSEAEPESFPLLRAKGESVELPIELATRIEEAVDARGKVRDWASERLAVLRERIRSLREELRNYVHSLVRKPSLGRFLQGELHTLRNGRYVLAVKNEYRHRFKGVVHGHSQTGATVYIEPEEIVDRGNDLAGALEGARREENRILLELTKELISRKEEIERVQQFVAWGDLTLAKAELVRVYRFTVPEISGDGVLSLHNARHPLLVWYHRGRDFRNPDLSHIQRSVVPFSVELGADFRILIVTGPNTGGKTVSLKAIGLCALMAASGLPVPASHPARVPLYNQVFVDVGDEQSLQQSLSTFSSHMKQVVRVLEEASRGDLVILDELGAGTDPSEGAALGTALLDELRERRAQVVVSTHLGSLKHYAYTHREAANAAMEFDPVTLTPTYRMMVGVPGRSCALLVAERLGLDPQLVKAARERIARPEPETQVIEKMEKARRAVESEKRSARRTRRRVSRIQKKVRKRLEEAGRVRETSKREAEEEIERKVKEVRDAFMKILPRLRSVPADLAPYVEHLESLCNRVLTLTPLGRRREEVARSLKKGERVYVPILGEVCRVVKINKGRRRLTVRGPNVQAEVGFDDISSVKPLQQHDGREHNG